MLAVNRRKVVVCTRSTADLIGSNILSPVGAGEVDALQIVIDARPGFGYRGTWRGNSQDSTTRGSQLPICVSQFQRERP